MNAKGLWNRRRMSRRQRVVIRFMWILGVLLAALTDSVALRVVGVGLIFAAVGVQLQAYFGPEMPDR
jgi:hypothetical protein